MTVNTTTHQLINKCLVRNRIKSLQLDVVIVNGKIARKRHKELLVPVNMFSFCRKLNCGFIVIALFCVLEAAARPTHDHE